MLVLFVGTMLSFLAGLFYFGWQSLEQSRVVETESIRTGLTRSADFITSEISRKLKDFEAQLTRLSTVPIADMDDAAGAVAKDLGNDALLVVFEGDAVRAYPTQRLLYRPAVTAPDQPDPQVFAVGESYEEKNDDYVRAILYFRDLADSEDAPDIRAGALLRLARNQKRAGLPADALATYEELERLASAWVDELPADLRARLARAGLLAELGRRNELTDEARRLERDLDSGRWPLTRAQYLQFAKDIQQWQAAAAPTAGPNGAAMALATSVDDLWRQWREDIATAGTMSGRGMRVAQLGTAGGVPSSEQRPMFRMWRGNSERFVALVGGQAFITDKVVAPLNALLAEHEVGLVLSDRTSGFSIAHALPRPDARTGGPREELRFDRVADEAVPWNLRVVSARQGPDPAKFSQSRTLLAVAIGILALMVIAGSYFSGRAITREMEAARLQSDFVAAVSHEFRTPLTLLRQFSDLLADGRVTSEDERHQYYGALQRGTRRLTRRVEDLLDFGRMEAGSHGFRFTNVDARTWVDHVLADFHDQFRAQGYHVELDWRIPDGAVMHADEAAISRALWNLLDNAVKYAPGSKTIWVDGTSSASKLTVSVRDRGLGVAAADRRAIFRKFVRGSMPDGSVVRGTGLGLALVQQIMHAHGGDVRLDRTSPEGSTFSLVLPLAPAGEHAPQRAQGPVYTTGVDS